MTISPLKHEETTSVRLHLAKNDLSEKVRSKAVALLGSRLADCVAFQIPTNQAYWNVKAPEFTPKHFARLSPPTSTRATARSRK
jgi:hypothetical protein